MVNVIEIRVRATDETGPVYDEARTRGAAAGRDSGAAFTSAYASHLRGVGGDDMSQSFASSLALIADADFIGPDSAAGRKIDDDAKKTGEQAGKDMGEGMSPLLASALAGAAAVGAPALLAGMGAAFTGVAALALKSNATIAADYQQLGKTAENAITQAAAPLAGTMHQAVTGLEGEIKALQPELDGLFANLGPDITEVTSGVGAFASGVLPGLSQSLGSSQVIVKDFSDSMGPLGSDVGSFFTGLTRDATTTGAGLQSVFGVLGNSVSTLGGVLGSAASAGSAALMGLDPVLDTTLGLVRDLSNPATVGGVGGLFAAFKLGGDTGALTSGLTSMKSGLASFAKDAETSEGAMGSLKSAAGGMSGAFGKAADVMSGPWGMAIGAGVGLLSGLAGAIYNAAHASDALTLSQQGLAQAVSQDSGHIGAATTAYVAAQAQSDGLAKSAAAAGVSLDTWTQAVIGNKAAQEQVTASVMAANQVTQNQKLITDEAATSTGKFSDEQRGAATAAQGSAAANNKLTDQNKQLLASMQAQNQQITDAINKQAQLQAATNALTNATNIFAASLRSQYQAQVASAQQSALSSVAAMNLGSSQTTLSQKIYQAETAYSLATAAAQGYATELTALNGTTMSLDQAQNTLAQQMITAKTSFAQNKYSMDQSTQAGVSNRQALVSAAQAIEALGVAQYQATGDINKGNETIQQQITNFVNATGATGKAKQAIQSYLESIAQIPPNVSTDVHANTGPASAALGSILNRINTSVGTITVRLSADGSSLGNLHGMTAMKATGGNIGAAATGGARGNVVQVGEQGPEFVRLPFGSTVIPHSNVQSMMASSGSGGAATNVNVEVSFGGNVDGAFATAFMNLVRTGKIQIKQSSIKKG